MPAMVWKAFGESFVTLLVILDPLGGIPLFLGLTRPLDPRARNRAAYVGVLAATGVLAGFAAFGQAVIQYLSISLESLMVAGVVLLVLRFAAACSRYLRPSAIDFVTRIMGLLLTAIAVQLVVDAVARWQHGGLG